MRKIYLSITMAMAVIFSVTAQDLTSTTNFEDLQLEQNSYWDGSDLSGSFTSGSLVFPNNYNPDWGTWVQWVYSNMADDSTNNYSNIYSAITATGYDTLASDGSTYAVCSVPLDMISLEAIPVPVYFADASAHTVQGFYVTNNSWAALAMENGDTYAKKFGGESGDDPDWFKLLITGFLNGTATDTLEFYLADYRFEDNSQDYIVKEWEWIDLSGLGKVDSLKFSLASSDVGNFGMNTPAYFCADNFVIVESAAGINEDIMSRIQLYPNPATNGFKIEGKNLRDIHIYNMNGQKILGLAEYNGEFIRLDNQPAGVYLVRFLNDGKRVSASIIRK